MPIPFDIDRYLNIRAATGPSFSPDGRFLAYLTNITGVAQVWQVPAEGGTPVQLTFKVVCDLDERVAKPAGFLADGQQT